MNDVEQNLQYFLMQLDGFREAVRQCQREVSEPIDQVISALSREKSQDFMSVSLDLDNCASKMTKELIPGLQNGLDHRLRILRVYLHE